MRLPARAALLLALSLTAPLCAPARAQSQIESREGIALQNQILEMRRDIQNLRDQIARGGGGGGGSAPVRAPAPSSGGGSNEMIAQLLDRVANLEEQVRQLRGRTDELGNQVQRQGDDLNKQIGDLNFRMQAIEGTGGKSPPMPQSGPPPTTLGAIAPPAPIAPAAPPPGAPPAGKRTPELTLQEGNAALARRDYTTAEADAREVLAGGRASPRAYDAQFLLAQSLAGRKDYSQAAIAYDDSYTRARTGTHAPDALLGLANSLTAINERRAACDTLVKLRSEFPTVRPDLRDQIAAARNRAGCS